jgi:CubicO group peptidase (beta-lactamase class C family)
MNPTSLLQNAVERRLFPGYAYAGGILGQSMSGSGGFTTYERVQAAGSETLWDLASLTKIFSTTSVAMVLEQEKVLTLDMHVASLLPRFRHEGVTVRQLLMHRSGLPAYASFQASCTTPSQAEDALYGLGVKVKPEPVYSCMGFMILQRVLEKLGGKTLDCLAQELVFQPLGLKTACYNPAVSVRQLCAPTESIPDWRRRLEDARGFNRLQEEWIQGSVHDPAAFMMGGVSGNAGLFADLSDCIALVEALAGFRKFFDPEVLSAWTKKQSPGSTRALGFDTKSPSSSSAGSLFGPLSYGHTGYTGTSFWIDPEAKRFVLLLTNRVHPDDKSNILKLRQDLADWAAEV